MKIQQPLRIAINGFGRIGRLVLRSFLEYQQKYNYPIEFVAINDIFDGATLLHLFKYDSTHGRLTEAAELQTTEQDFFLKVKNLPPIQLLQEKNPENLPWESLRVDVVLECTGLFRSYEQANMHLTAGAKKVIIGSAPFDTVDASIVYGVNHTSLKTTDRVLSSVSCTTQALVPLVKILDDHFGIESAMMTEIHAMTADQTVLDQTHRDLRRARSASFNIIPTTSSSLGALKRVLPHMHNKIEGYSIRVPTLNVASIDLTFLSSQRLNVQEINQLLVSYSQGTYQEIMAVSNEPLVSSDFNHQPYSLIVDLSQTQTIGQLHKVFAWYDNEWGYATRLVDLIHYLASIS